MTPYESIRAALTYVPAHDRETWVRMAMAVKAELGDDGFDVWSEWSAQDESYTPTAAKEVWKSVKSNGKVGIGTLFYEAKQRGYQPLPEANAHTPSAAEIAERERIKREASAADEAQRKRRRDEAASKAARIWKAAAPASADHPYLVRKCVQPVTTLRELDVRTVKMILGYPPKQGDVALTGRLLIVPVKIDDNFSTLELIDEAGNKSALADGAKRGGHWASQTLPDGDGQGLTLAIGEGVVTVLSACQATEHPGVAALSAGNLSAVAEKMRQRYPAARLVVLAELGAGEEYAYNAARDSSALVALPDFGDNRPEDAKDMNDLCRLRGREAVASAIANAKAPEVSTPQPSEKNAAAAVLEGRDWPEPLTLPHGLPPVQPFDMAMLPDKLHPWVSDICDRVQCAPDFVGATVMAALGSVIGRKIGIRPQNKTDWTVVANQWALIIGRPGVLKSPAMEQALAPLKRLAALAAEGHEAEIEQHKIAVRLAKLQAEAGEKRARKELTNNASADVTADLATEEPDAPILRRFIANDATSAALGELLLQNPNGTLVYRDELVSLLKNLDREDNAEARGFYLTGWNGDGAYTFDRIGRGMNLHIRAVCLSVLGSTQPGRIAEYVHSAVKGGAGDDGLIQRFGLTVWPDTSGEWRDVDRWPDSIARHEANGVFERLNLLDPNAIGARTDEFDALPYLRFDEEAGATFVEWRGSLEKRLLSGELHPAMESHLAKYRKLVPGLALIIHLADGGSGAVSGLALLKALAWAEYLETHAKRLYESATSPEVPAAKAIVQRLRRGDLPHSFASRDVYRKGWAHLSGRQQVEDALQLLIEYGWVDLVSRDTTGRTATIYTANPRGFQ